MDWAVIKLSLVKRTVSRTGRPKSTCLHPSVKLSTSIWPQIWTLMHFSTDWAPWFSWKNTNMLHIGTVNASMWKVVFSYSLYCYSAQLEVFSALCPTSNIFMHNLFKGQRNLFAEMASGRTAGGHQELSWRSSDKTRWVKSSYIIHPTCSKGSIWSYRKSSIPIFLVYAVFSEQG